MNIKPNGTMSELLRQDTEIWDLFTRKEEYAPGLRDEFDRFPPYQKFYSEVYAYWRNWDQ